MFFKRATIISQVIVFMIQSSQMREFSEVGNIRQIYSNKFYAPLPSRLSSIVEDVSVREIKTLITAVIRCCTVFRRHTVILQLI